MILSKFFLYLIIFTNGYLFSMEAPIRTYPIAIVGTHINGKPIDTTQFDPNYTDLHDAAYHGRPTLEKLIKERKNKGQSIDPENRFGQTPLWLAAKRPQPISIELLVRYGAELDHKDIWNRTPLSLMQYSSRLLEIISKAKQGNNQ